MSDSKHSKLVSTLKNDVEVMKLRNKLIEEEIQFTRSTNVKNGLINEGKHAENKASISKSFFSILFGILTILGEMLNSGKLEPLMQYLVSALKGPKKEAPNGEETTESEDSYGSLSATDTTSTPPTEQPTVFTNPFDPLAPTSSPSDNVINRINVFTKDFIESLNSVDPSAHSN